MKSLNKLENIKTNGKKKLKSAAKKRNNNNCSAKDFDQSVEDSHILDLISKNCVDNENQNRKLGFEELFTDFESNN